MNLKRPSTYKITFFAILLVHFYAIAQDSLSLSIKQDTIVVNDLHTPTLLDSTKNAAIKSYTVTENGESFQLISIDKSRKDNSLKKWLFISMSIIVTILIVWVIFYYLKKKKDSSTSRLTKQELNIARLINSGKTNLEVADELCISMSTVKTHINNIYRKLNISSRKELKTSFGKSRGLDPKIHP